MKLQLSRLIPNAALLCLILVSCKKNEAITSSPTQNSTSSLSQTTSMIGAMSNETDYDFSTALASEEKISNTDACPVRSYNPSKDVYPHTTTIDYGTGCTDDDGITRTGKRFITVYADDDQAPAGKVVSVITYSNYTVNGVSITGSSKIKVVNPASTGKKTLRIMGTQTATDANGNTSTYVSYATRNQIGGRGDDIASNDVYRVTENCYGTEVLNNSTMVTWTSKTDPSNPVKKMRSCSFRSQGGVMISLKVNGQPTDEYLDYGNGDCDDQATLTIDGTSQSITLPFYFFQPHW